MTPKSGNRAAHPRPTRVLLVDDHQLVREGVIAALNDDHDISVVADVGTIAEAHEAVERCAPHVTLLDHQLPDGGGIDTCPALLEQQPSLRIVILTQFGSADLAQRALAAGAFGFIVKTASPQRLRDAVHAVMAGIRVTDRSVQGPRFDLSERELEVLRLLAEGHSNDRIAERVGVSSHSVRTYVSRIMAKLGAKNRTDAASYAVAYGLVHRTK